MRRQGLPRKSGVGRPTVQSRFARDGDVGHSLRLRGGGGPPAAHWRPPCLAAASGAGGGWLSVAPTRHRRSRGEFRRANAVVVSAGRGPRAALDPYGVVSGPAQVCAAEIRPPELGLRVLELGAGTGSARSPPPRAAPPTCSRPTTATAARAPRQSAERGGFALRMAQFDILDAARPLPRRRARRRRFALPALDEQALGRRCAEALRAGCASVIVGDCGRPGRATLPRRAGGFRRARGVGTLRGGRRLERGDRAPRADLHD